MKKEFPNSLPLLLDIHGQSAMPEAVLRGTCNGKTFPQFLKEYGSWIASLVFSFIRYGYDSVIGKNSIYGHLSASGIPIYPDCSGIFGKEPFELTGEIRQMEINPETFHRLRYAVARLLKVLLFLIAYFSF